jgi:rubredoxin-NAD+ reductase
MGRIIIIGSGLGGYTLATEYRKRDPETEIMLITQDDGQSYSKPLLSNAFSQKKNLEQLAMGSPEVMAKRIGLTLLNRTAVSHVDVQAKTIDTSSGRYDYGSLILALGAEPVRIPVLGTGADAILAVNDLQDYLRFRAAIEGARRVLIMGAGLIGCEFANDLLHAGISPIVVDPNTHPLFGLVPQPIAVTLQTGLEAAGVQWQLGTKVTSVDKMESSGYLATLDNGTALEADVVLSAVGLRPRIELAAAAGIAVKRGILVDEFGRTSHPHIYALGDCAEYAQGLLPFVRPVLLAAQSMAATLTGAPTRIKFPAMPVGVKTPACPVSVQRPPSGHSGDWVSEPHPDGVRLVFQDDNGAMKGFAVSGRGASVHAAALVKRLGEYVQ